MKKVIITGGSGFFGTRLSKTLIGAGYHVVSVDLAPSSVAGVVHVPVDILKPFPRTEALADPFAVVNLAGKSIFSRWTNEAKRLIYNTRVIGTRNLVASFENERFRPEVLVSASAVGYYGDCGDEKITTTSQSAGSGFLARVSKDWEQAARHATAYGVRTAVIRNGHILGSTGGLVKTLLPLYRFGLGGPLGDGSQWMPWIHIDDLVQLYVAAIENNWFVQTANGVTRYPVRNQTFSRELANQLNRPHFLSVPGWALRLVFGEFGEEMRFSQLVTSTGASNYHTNTYEKLPVALHQIVVEADQADETASLSRSQNKSSHTDPKQSQSTGR